MARPDFGMLRTTLEQEGREPVVLECRAIVPGLSLHDLTMVFENARKEPGLSHWSGNPSKWPDVHGIHAVVDAVLDAIYGKEEAQDGGATAE